MTQKEQDFGVTMVRKTGSALKVLEIFVIGMVVAIFLKLAPETLADFTGTKHYLLRVFQTTGWLSVFQSLEEKAFRSSFDASSNEGTSQRSGESDDLPYQDQPELVQRRE
jgi:hypothetical protein